MCIHDNLDSGPSFQLDSQQSNEQYKKVNQYYNKNKGLSRRLEREWLKKKQEWLGEQKY